MTIDSLTGVIDWTPGCRGGRHRCGAGQRRQTAANTTQTYTLNIVIPNQVPVITSTPVTTGEVDSAYSYLVVATDGDNDPLTFALTDAPLGMSI